MNIVVNGYIGKKLTGVGKTLLQLLLHTKKADDNLKFVVYTNFDNYEFINQLKDAAITVKTFKISKNNAIGNLLYNLIVFPFITNVKTVDAVYIANVIPIIVSFKPIVLTLHDMIEFRVPEKFSKSHMIYRKVIIPLMTRFSNVITTVSLSSKKDIAEICKIPENKIEILKWGLTIDENRDTNFMDSESEVDYLLYVGTVDFPGKNVHGIISAYETGRDEFGFSNKLLIAGMPGKGFEVIAESIEKSKYKNDIKLLGYVEEKQLKLLYKNAKVFLFVSYYEGFGLPVLEAMASGIPVITSTKSSLPEIAGNAAILCDPNDITSIKKAIITLLKDEDKRSDLIAKGYENIKSYSWESVALKFSKILHAVKV
jgi:glycosyltransferase involved in cell wall biosynthesis